jgi:hypothetical protein
MRRLEVSVAPTKHPFLPLDVNGFNMPAEIYPLFPQPHGGSRLIAGAAAWRSFAHSSTRGCTKNISVRAGMLRYEIGRECRNLSHLFESRRLANRACVGASDFVGIELKPTYGDFGQAALGREFRDRTQVRYCGLVALCAAELLVITFACGGPHQHWRMTSSAGRRRSGMVVAIKSWMS